jgi:hypothetical protein
MEDFFRPQANARDGQGTSVLQHAIRNGDVETIGILLGWGAIPDPGDVEFAVRCGRQDAGKKADMLRCAEAQRARASP